MDKEPGQRDYGTLVHAIIEEFNNIYPGDIPENIQDILLELGKKHFQTMQLSKELEAFWRPKFEKPQNGLLLPKRNIADKSERSITKLTAKLHTNSPEATLLLRQKPTELMCLKTEA